MANEQKRQRWADQARATQIRAQQHTHDPNDGMATAGYWLAILVSPVGLLVGLVLMIRGDERGVRIVVLSVVVMLVLLVLVG